jgi:hypothetical protein
MSDTEEGDEAIAPPRFVADEADIWQIDGRGRRIKWIGRLSPSLAASVAAALTDGRIAMSSPAAEAK